MILKRVGATIKKYDMLPEGSLVLCAVSGGRDSMALLNILGELSGKLGFTVAAAHFNHCLRPTADRDEGFVRSWCRVRGIAFVSGKGDAGAFAKTEGRGLEDAARTLRYGFLEEAADKLGAAKIATAHHREDNAETVLLHLLRGSGLGGLGGIAPVRGRIVRPLLEVGRGEIEAYLIGRGIPYVDDETNMDVGFTRNRLRLEVMPLLEELYPGCAKRLAASAELLREDEEHLRRETAGLLPPATGGAAILPVSVLKKRDLAIRRRLIRAMGHQLGVSLDRAAVETALGLKNNGCADLPGGLWACREEGRIILRPAVPPPEPVELHPGEQAWGIWRVRVTEGCTPSGSPRQAVLDAGKIPGPLTLAPWDGRGRLAVGNGSRSIKRLFADRGIPPGERRNYPALYLDGRCVAVPGVAVDEDLLPPPGGKYLTVDVWNEP